MNSITPAITKKNRLLGAVMLCLVVGISGCASNSSSSPSSGSESSGAEAMNTEATTTEPVAEATAEPDPGAGATNDGDAAVASGNAGAAATNGNANDGPNVPEGRVLMRFQGDEGTEFSGTCSVNGEEESMDGSVPDRRSFQLPEGSLDCTLTNDSDGVLRVLLDSGSDRSVYEINTPESEISFSYSSSGSSSSVTSSNSSSSSSQSSSVTSSGDSSSSSSSVVVQQSSQSSQSSSSR